MVELGANDEQLDFPIVYTSAVNGYARNEFDDGNMDMTPLFDAIIGNCRRLTSTPEKPFPCRSGTILGPFQGQVAGGRASRGTIHRREGSLIKNDGSKYQAQVKQLFTFEGMGRLETESAHAGDICAVVGISDDVTSATPSPPHRPRSR